MDQTNVEQFIELLEDELKDVEDMGSSIAVLKKNRINGKRAKLLKTSDLFKMGIPFGDAMELESAFEDIAENFKTTDPPTPAVVSSQASAPSKEAREKLSESRRKDTPKKPEGAIGSHKKPVSDSKSDDDSGASSTCSSSPKKQVSEENSDDLKSTASSNEIQDEADNFDCLKQYFSATDWREMSDYDKAAYQKQYDNFHRLKQLAVSSGKPVSNLKQPSFMSRNKTSATKDSNSSKSSSKKSVSNKTNGENNRETKANKTNGENNRETKEKKSAKRKKDKENEDPKNRAVPYVKKRKISTVHSHGPKDIPESEYIESLPEYDVESVLADAGDKLETVRKLLSDDGIVFGNQRRLLVRTLTKYLFFESVKDPKDVTQLHKEGLAASICTKWPKFKDESNTRYSWHMFFYRKSNTGFIANCVQTIYRSLDSSQKRRPRHKKPEKTPVPSSSEANFDPEKEHKWISLLVANRHNHDEIFEGMKDSFSARRNWIIQKSPSITEILKNYVHLMSFGGQLLDIEFSLMEPGKSSCLLKEFATLSSKVKKLTSLKPLEDFDCEGLQVLVALAELLPAPNVLKRNKRSSECPKALVQDLVTIYAPGSDSKSIIAQKRKKQGTAVQPYLLAYVPERTIKKMFVVCDADMIEIEGCNFLKGLDLLFKSYFVFNVEYPLGWTFVFQFLEHGIYKINQDAFPNTGKELLKRLSSVQID